MNWITFSGLAFSALISTIFAPPYGYFYQFSGNDEGCYYAEAMGAALQCATDCSYALSPTDYCDFIPENAGCPPTTCDIPPAGTTYCNGCPLVPMLSCNLGVGCPCEPTPIPLSFGTCTPTGSTTSRALSDGSSLNISSQFLNTTLELSQIIGDLVNGTLLCPNTGGVFPTVNFSAGSFVPIGANDSLQLQCEFGAGVFLVYDTVAGDVTANCTFHAVNSTSNAYINVTGEVVVSGTDSGIDVAGPAVFVAGLEGLVSANGTVEVGGSISFEAIGSGVIVAPVQVTFLEAMTWNISNGTAGWAFGTPVAFDAGNSITFLPGEAYNMTWDSADTVTVFDETVTLTVHPTLSLDLVVFSIPAGAAINRGLMSTICEQILDIQGLGFSNLSIENVCIYQTVVGSLSVNMSALSLILPNSAMVLSADSVASYGVMSVVVGAGNMDPVGPSLVMVLNSGDQVSIGAMKKATEAPILVVVLVAAFAALNILSSKKSTGDISMENPTASFVDSTINLEYGLWEICNNSYYASTGSTVSPNGSISIPLGSYLGIPSACGKTAYFVATSNMTIDPCAPVVLPTGQNVTALMEVTSGSFAELYYLYLNAGGTIDQATSNVLLNNGSQFNITVETVLETLTFNGSGVGWSVCENSANVPGQVPILISGNPVPLVFAFPVVIASNGYVYNTNNQQLGYIDANSQFVSLHVPTFSIPAQCKNETLGLYVVNRRSSCAANGWAPVPVTNSNFNAVSQLIYNCGGPGAQAAIGSWEGSTFGADFANSFLVFTVGYVSGGGGDIAVATSSNGFPFVCVNE